jgi:hypothetical protein
MTFYTLFQLTFLTINNIQIIAQAIILHKDDVV